MTQVTREQIKAVLSSENVQATIAFIERELARRTEAKLKTLGSNIVSFQAARLRLRPTQRT